MKEKYKGIFEFENLWGSNLLLPYEHNKQTNHGCDNLYQLIENRHKIKKETIDRIIFVRLTVGHQPEYYALYIYIVFNGYHLCQ